MNHYATERHFLQSQSQGRAGSRSKAGSKPHLRARTPRTSRTVLVPMGVEAPRRRDPAENQYCHIRLSERNMSLELPVSGRIISGSSSVTSLRRPGCSPAQPVIILQRRGKEPGRHRSKSPPGTPSASPPPESPQRNSRAPRFYQKQTPAHAKKPLVDSRFQFSPSAYVLLCTMELVWRSSHCILHQEYRPVTGE